MKILKSQLSDTDQKTNRGIGRSLCQQQDFMQNIFDLIIEQTYDNNILLFKERVNAVKGRKREQIFVKTAECMRQLIPEYSKWNEKKRNAVRREVCRALRGERQYGYKISNFVSDWESRHDVSNLKIPVNPVEDYSGLTPLLEKARSMQSSTPVTKVSSKMDIVESIVALLEAGAVSIETDGTAWKVTR